MARDRVRLFKIRRLVKRDGVENFEWYVGARLNKADVHWCDDSIDAYAFTSIESARRIVEPIKAKNKDPEVIYHTVVPA